MRGRTDNDLRALVRTERKRRGLTQEEMAQRADLSLRTYQGFESGKSWPQRANLVAILTALDIQDVEQTTAEEPTWSGDVQQFLNMMGAFLEHLGDADRLRFMREETYRIFAQMNRTSVLTPDEEAGARAAIHAAMADEEEVRPARRRKTSQS